MIAHFLRTLAASILGLCIGWGIFSDPPIELLVPAFVAGWGLVADVLVHLPGDLERLRLGDGSDEQEVLRPRWLYWLLVLAGAVLGIKLLATGDTAERVVGVLLALPALFIAGAFAWAVLEVAASAAHHRLGRRHI